MKKQTPNRIILINALSAGLLNGISMLMLPVYSYLLGPDNYGLASIYTTWSSILGIIIGVQASSSIAVAQKDFSKEDQLPFQANGVYLGLAMTIIFSAIFLIFSGFISNFLSLPKWSVLLLCPHAFGIFCIGMLNSKFTYEFKQDRNLILSVSMSLGTALVSVIAILCMSQEQRYFGKVIGTAVPQIICGIVLLVFFLKKVGLCIRKEYLKYIIHYSLPLVFSNICLHLFSSSDKLMLQRMGSNEDVGIYSLAFSFTSVLSSIWYALNHAWCPFYYKYENEGRKTELIRHLKNYIRLFSVLTIGFILLASEVFKLFSAPEFWTGEKIIPILAIAFYLNFVSGHARLYLYYNKETKMISVISILVSLFNLFFNALLIPILGVAGAGFGTLFAYIIELIASWNAARKKIVGEKMFSCSITMFSPYFFLVIVSVCLFYCPETEFIRWGGGLILGLWLIRKLLISKEIL